MYDTRRGVPGIAALLRPAHLIYPTRLMQMTHPVSLAYLMYLMYPLHHCIPDIWTVVVVRIGGRRGRAAEIRRLA
ncbi:hypothetical protein [Streptomyces sp. NPDC055299]